jgi:AraC-like DNA-binding protein
VPGWDLRVLPDGRVDVVWDGRRLAAVWAGAEPLRVPVRCGRPTVGVRLRLGAAARLWGDDLWSHPGLAVPLADLVDGAASAPLAERLVHASSAGLALGPVLERGLVGLASDAGPDPLAEVVARWAGRPGVTADRIATRLGWSARALRRRVRAEIGLGPAELARVARFGRFRRRLPELADRATSLAALAAELGYADQSHLGRECRELSGSTPTELVATWRRGTGGARPESSRPARRPPRTLARWSPSD